MKPFTVVLLTLGVALLVTVPAWARGSGGHSGHCHSVGSVHGNVRGSGSSTQVLATGSAGVSDFSHCPVALPHGTVCPVGGVYQATAPPGRGAPESDLGPWWVFLFLGRSVAGGIRWLAGL